MQCNKIMGDLKINIPQKPDGLSKCTCFSKNLWKINYNMLKVRITYTYHYKNKNETRTTT